jgi:hypothetical protein
MKGRFAALKIDAYSSKMDPKSPVHSLNVASFSQYVPPDASDIEVRIHKYLDQNSINMMDVKQII